MLAVFEFYIFSETYHLKEKFSRYSLAIVPRDSSVGIATSYGLDGPEFEFLWGRDFPHPSRPAPGAHPASYTIRNGSFPGVKRPGRGVEHSPPLTPRLRKE
jgi:hypothetical protein